MSFVREGRPEAAGSSSTVIQAKALAGKGRDLGGAVPAGMEGGAAAPSGEGAERADPWGTDAGLMSAMGLPELGGSPVVQRRASGPGAPADGPSVTAAASAGLAGGGGALPYREQMESAFGQSFGDVRVHTGAAAAGASKAIGAEAYTMGNDIVLGGASPSPSLIAHELTHVVQQRAGSGPSSGVGTAGDRWEQEADAASTAVTAGQQVSLPYGPGANVGAAVQRLAVQRYESGEHAQLGSGMSYPFNLAERALPNGAMATTGELVAFGDFYADMEQLRSSPRQETESLVGLCRFEAIWQLAERQKHNAPLGGSATTDPTSPRRPEGAGPDAEHLATAGHVTWGDSVWDTTPPGCPSTLRQRATEIHAQFSPAWEFFGMSLGLTTKPNMNVAAMRTTLGRRRFRGTNDALGAPGTADPGHAGGDYFDLAGNNVSHFAISNWSSWREMHERACTDAADPAKLQDALTEDALGAHFLTDQFAAGHMVDKQELMTYATQMVVNLSVANGRSQAGDDRDGVIRDMLTEALQQCFDYDDVYQAWVTGCQRAHDQGFLRRDEMELMTSIPRGNYVGNGVTVVGQIVNTIMAMPWRNAIDPRSPGGGAERSQGNGDAPRGRGDYHLGMGNLAALQVHEALNHIGFIASNENGDTWNMQGDGHLTAETQRIGQMAVDESQRQVNNKASNLDAVKKFTPTKAKMDPAAFDDFFGGNHEGVLYNPTSIAAMMTEVRAASTTPIDLASSDGRTVSPQMRDICHRIMDALFTAHPSDQDATDSGTGLNISMLRAFLLERLPDMVAAAYAAADVADLPQAAQEAYVPRAADGSALPSAANNFRWTGDQLDFKLNISGCAPGATFTIGLQVHDLDSGYDTTSTGQTIPDQMMVDDDEVMGTFTQVVTIPASTTADASGRNFLDVSWTMSGRGAGDGDAYVTVFADSSCTMVLGRSNARSETGVGNAAPTEAAPRVTGPDATAPAFYRATAIVGNAFVWDGPTVRFRVNHNAPPGAAPTSPVKIWYRTFNRDLGYDYGEGGSEVEGWRNDDPEIGGIREATANLVGDESTDFLLQPEDNAGDTYIVVYADAGASQSLGRSNVQGENRGALRNQLLASRATATSGFSWSGNSLSFAVTPSSAATVWIKFYDEDWGNDHDEQGNRLAGSRNEDPQVGGIHAVNVTSGRATVAATGDANNPGDTYAIVYADAACTQPIGRSVLQP